MTTPGALDSREVPYSPAVRPAFLFAEDRNRANDIEWHAFVNRESEGTITHVWGLPPPLATACKQEVWAVPADPKLALGSPAAILDGNKNIHVFFFQADNRVWQVVRGLSQDSDNWYVGQFGGSNNTLPAPSGDPAALLTPDGTQHVFYCTTAGGLWHIWWDPFTRPNGGTGTFSAAAWGNQPAIGAPAAFQDSDGRIHVLYRREGDVYQTIGQTERNKGGGTTYTNFQTLPFGNTSASIVGDIAAVITSSGNQCAVYRSATNGIMMRLWSKSDRSWFTREIFPNDDCLTMVGNPWATVIDGQWALVLSGATSEYGSYIPGSRDSAVAFLCPLDKKVTDGGPSTWRSPWRDLWGPWCNLPLPPLLPPPAKITTV